MQGRNDEELNPGEATGWDEKVLRGKMERPRVLFGKEDEKKNKMISKFEYLKR